MGNDNLEATTQKRQLIETQKRDPYRLGRTTVSITSTITDITAEKLFLWVPENF